MTDKKLSKTLPNAFCVTEHVHACFFYSKHIGGKYQQLNNTRDFLEGFGASSSHSSSGSSAGLPHSSSAMFRWARAEREYNLWECQTAYTSQEVLFSDPPLQILITSSPSATKPPLAGKNQCGVVVKNGRLVIWGTGFVSPLLHMQLLGDLGLVTLL